jgi:hypothetical protein
MALLNVPTPRFKPGSGVQQPQVQQVLREAPTPAAAQAGPTLTPEQVARKRAIAEQLAQSGMDYSPVQHWTQGLARVANALAGNMEEARADDAEKQGKRDAADQLTQLQAMRGEPGADPKSSIAMAMALADNPWATPGMKAIIAPMIQKDSETPEEREMRGLQLQKLKNEASGLTPDQKEYQQAVSQGYGGSFTDYKKETKGGVNIDMGGGTNKQVFEEIKSSADAARTAQTGLTSLREAKQALEQGGFFGQGADYFLAMAKAGKALGFTSESNDKKIAATEIFRSAIAPQVASVMKATVGSTQISNADRDFAEKAAGGNINLDPATISRLLGIMERAAKVAIQKHSERLDKVYPDSGEFGRERALFEMQAPAVQAPPPGRTPPPSSLSPADIEEIDRITGYGGKGGPEQFAPLPPENPDPYGIKALSDQRKATVARHQRMLSKP